MKPTSSVDNPHWGECYYDHFALYLGEPTNQIQYYQTARSERPWIRIMQFENILGGCRAFCTFGLSHYPSQIGEFAEICMPVDRAWNETPDILVNSVATLILKQLRIGRGRSILIPKVDAKNIAQYDKTAIYLTVPFGIDDAFQSVQCGPIVGQVYLAFYISKAEYDYHATHGTDRFETLLEDNNVDVFNVGRPSVV